ncbi:nucleoside recognition domain-containing protein [Treponema sp.]
MDRTSVIRRVASATVSAIKPALTTTRFLVAVMVPVSLAVLLLERFGFMHFLSIHLDPYMHFLGLSGTASLAFISAMFLNNYSAIAVMGTLGLGMREITILATMCLIAHNLIVESAVMKRTGSSATKMVFLRIGTAIFAAWMMNLILPQAPETVANVASNTSIVSSFKSFSVQELPLLFKLWLFQSGLLMLKVTIIVCLLMLVQKLMDEFGVMELLARVTSPLMKVFGLPPSAGFLWIIANVIGLAYGSAIMIERAESGKMSPSDEDLFNHHVAISHSLLEDSFLYLAIGVPTLLIILPRLLLAIIIVWLERARRFLFRRSFRVGTL